MFFLGGIPKMVVFHPFLFESTPKTYPQKNPYGCVFVGHPEIVLFSVGFPLKNQGENRVPSKNALALGLTAVSKLPSQELGAPPGGRFFRALDPYPIKVVRKNTAGRVQKITPRPPAPPPPPKRKKGSKPRGDGFPMVTLSSIPDQVPAKADTPI